MAGMRDLLKPKGNHDGKAKELVKPLAKEYPWVAETFAGTPAKDDQAAISAGAIKIYIRDGKWRFAVTYQQEKVTLYGDIGDVLNPWGSINSMLAMGEVGFKEHSERSDSYTKEQKESLL